MKVRELQGEMGEEHKGHEGGNLADIWGKDILGIRTASENAGLSLTFVKPG